MTVSSHDQWFVYLVKCKDGSLYTGIAKDVAARIAQHNEGKGAKYTRGRGPVRLQIKNGPYSYSEALSLEARIKKLPAKRKKDGLESA